MAAKNALKINADWASVISKLGSSDVGPANRLKSAVESNATRVSQLPDSLPKIDWSFYKAGAANPKIVEDLEKNYKTIVVERLKPPQSRLNELKEAEEADLERFEKFKAVCESYVDSSQKLKAKFEKIIPFKDMEPDDWALTFPDWDTTLERPPSLAPHFGRVPGLSRDEVIALEQPDPIPYATPGAWKEWNTKWKKVWESRK